MKTKRDGRTDGRTDRRTGGILKKLPAFYSDTAYLFAVILKTAHPKRQADGWLEDSFTVIS